MILAREIATQEDIPYAYLTKILQTLAKESLLTSKRGRSGGFQLNRTPNEITLYEIKACIDGTADIDMCAVGMSSCDELTPCPIHGSFKPIRDSIKSYLHETTLDTIVRGYEIKLKKNRSSQ